MLRYAEFLRAAAGLSDRPRIDLSRIYRHFGMPAPRRAELPGQQGLLLNPDTGQFVINQNDVATRQRFTEAHELMELLFSRAPGGGAWAARERGRFRRGQKEALCNRGAAELLMPRASFLPRVEEHGVSLATANQLARQFYVSPMAALVNMARVGPGLHTVILWSHRRTPAEQRALESGDQASLFGRPGHQPPPKRLRVVWAIGVDGGPYIPSDKAVDEESSIFRAWKERVDTEGEDDLALGALNGRCRCENRSLQVDGEPGVLSLVHLPGTGGVRGRW